MTQFEFLMFIYGVVGFLCFIVLNMGYPPSREKDREFYAYTGVIAVWPITLPIFLIFCVVVAIGYFNDLVRKNDQR
jgi:hypothetical protein